MTEPTTANYPRSPQLRTRQEPHLKWSQSVEKMRCLGKVLIALGLLLAAGSGAGGFVFAVVLPNQALLIAVCVVGGAGSIATFSLSIYLHRKSYWKDPVYQRERKKLAARVVTKSGYNLAKKKYGEEWRQHDTLTNTEVNDLLFNGGHWANATYLEIIKDEKNNLHQDRNRSQLNIRFLLETCEYTTSHTIATYGWQPFEDGIVTADDRYMKYDTFKERFKTETETLTFDEIYKAYKGKDGFWNIIKYRIADAESLGDKARAQLQGMAFSKFIESYGWIILDRNVVTPADLINAALKELNETTFEDFIERCGWLPFEKNILSSSFSLVIKKFNNYLKECETICTFLQSFYKEALKFNLIIPRLEESLQKFHQALSEANQDQKMSKDNAQYDYNQKVREAKVCHDHSRHDQLISDAARERDIKIENSLMKLNKTRDSIEREWKAIKGASNLS